MSNSVYYGIPSEPSSDFFAHYGVRGMKWGVRKAIDKHSEKRLDRQYRKAKRKLEKLNSRADVDIQKIASKKHARRALAAAGLSVAGSSLSNETRRVAKRIINAAYKPELSQNVVIGDHVLSWREKNIVGNGKGIKKTGSGLGIGPVGRDSHASTQVTTGVANSVSKKSNPFVTVDKVAKGIAVAGLGTAAYQTGKAVAAKYRTTKKGHAKAVAKRDAWRKEMQSAFKGTKYDTSKRRRKK